MAGYTYLWEYQVRPGQEGQFERHYGPQGTWAALFRQAAGYRETLLLRDRSDPGRYVTVDRWESEAAFHAFRAQFAEAFEALDEACEQLTARETPLGEFSE